MSEGSGEKYDALNERVTNLYGEVVKVCGVIDEMSNRLTEQSESIRTLNHNSTAMASAIARLEVKVDNNTEALKTFRDELQDSLKTWLTVAGLAITVVTFIINYFKG